MPAISWGYNGPLYQENWARLAALMSARYVVDPDSGPNPFGVAGIDGSRRIAVGAGTALAAGVLCELTDTEVIDLPAVAAGTSRTYMVVLRRTWGETPASALELLYYSATANITPRDAKPTTLPASFQSVPGVVDDQPLAWVWFNGTDNTVQVFDLRTYTLDTIIRGMRPEIYEFKRLQDYDVPLSAGYTALVGGVIPNARAGTYLIKAALALYGSANGLGYAHIYANGAVDIYRYDVREVSMTYAIERLHYHPGGDLAIDAGYQSVFGTTIALNIAGGVTRITAAFLGGQ